MKGTALSKKVMSLILATILLFAAMPLSQIATNATAPVSSEVTVNKYEFSPLKIAKKGSVAYKYANSVENADGSLDVGVISSSSKTVSYFEPALSDGAPFSFKANTYYKITFDYKVNNMDGTYIRLAPARVATERFESSLGISVYADENKVARIANNTTFLSSNNPADFAETVVVTEAQSDFVSYSITVKSPASFSHASGTTYDDLLFLLSSDNKNYTVTFKNLVILECEELPSVELVNGDGSVYSTIAGFPGETFSVTDLPKLAPSQKYYTNEERTVEFASGVYGVTDKVYITKTPYNLYYSENVDVVNVFNNNAASRTADGNLVVNNTGLHSTIFQPSFGGNGFKLKASTHYSITFKYKVTKNDDTHLNIYPFRFSVARVNAGGTSYNNAASDPNTNRRITAKEAVSTNYAVMSKLPETIKIEGTNEDYVTYTYTFTTPDSLYFSTVKYDYDDLFIAVKNGSKATAKKFTVEFKDFEIRETNANSGKVEIYSGDTLEQTLIGFPEEVISLPVLSPMYRYYTDKACKNEFVAGSVFGEGTTKVYKSVTPELFIENFNYPPYTNSEFMVGTGLNSSLYKHFRYSVAEDGSTLNYQMYYKDIAAKNEGTVGNLFGNTGSTYVPVGIMTDSTSFYTLKSGKTYVIEFDYNVESLDATGGGAGHTYNGENQIKFGIARVHNSINGKEQRAVSMAQTLAGAGESAYNIATVKETGSGHIVKSFTVYDWVNESYSVDTSAWDGLAIVMAGYGKVSIDNIRVIPMAETEKTLVTFNPNGGSDVCDGNALLVDNIKKYTLPTPTRAGYVFKGWYTDTGLSKKFDASKYERTDGILSLYAKWQGANEVLEGIEISDFMNNAPYIGIMSGTSNAGVASLRYQAVADSINGYLRYKYAYEDGKGSLVSNVGGQLVDSNGIKFNQNGFGNRGDHKGANGTGNAAVMLALPDSTSATGYSPVKVEIGKHYYVTFDYLPKSLDTVNPYSGNNKITIGVGRVVDASNTKYYVDSQNTSGNPAVAITTANTEWQSAGYVFTPYDSSSMSDQYAVNKSSYNLALMVSGYGEVYIDNIRVYCMEDNKNYSVLNFESNGGSECDDMIFKSGTKPNLPVSQKADFEFGGWYTDKELTNKFDAATYKRTTGVVRLYAKWLGVETYKIDFENPRMYYNNNELTVRNTGKAYHRYDFVTDPTNSANKILKYQYNYAEVKEDVFGAAKGSSGSALAGAVLYNPETLSALILNEGDVIKVSIRYKVQSVEKGNVSMDLRTTNPNNSSHLPKTQVSSIYSENAPTEWKTIEIATQITGINSDEKYIANALAIGMSGYGVVLVDDIVVTRYTGYVVGFETKTDNKIMPIMGKPGGSVALPTVSKEGCIFSGWYTDPEYKNKYEGSVYKFNEKAEMLYAKFKACQIKQDFEDYTPLSMQTWSDFCINNPSSEEYDLDLVHTGDASVFRRGNEAYTRQTAIFDDTDMPTLEIGETYTLQMWVKPVELFIEDVNLMMRHCAQFDRCYSDQETWAELGLKSSDYNKVGKGKQLENLVLCSDLVVGEWNLVTYEFTAITPYIAIATPEYNKIAFDDVTITLKGAEGYELDKDTTVREETEEEEVVKKVIRTDPNHIFAEVVESGSNVVISIVSIAGGAVVIAAGVLLIIFRKKIFKKKV